jgi:membrane protease YdiL (CAAX protease family)
MEVLKVVENMKQRYIFVSSLIACMLLYLVEQVLGVDYFVKTFSKVMIFTLVPYVYIKAVKKSSIVEELNLRKLNKKNFKLGFLFGMSAFTILIAGYFIFKNFIDLDTIAAELTTKLKITPGNFIFIGLYITFGNSFLEEFFFRGFVFLNLHNTGDKRLAYIYSSLLFALYHIAIFKSWFNIWLILLCLLGLFIVGLLFNWLNTKSKNFINSWLVHILADSAIILIGMRMFRII